MPMKNRIVYRGFYIDRTATGYRICRQDSAKVHAHLKNLNPSYKLIDNVIAGKIPRRCSCYYLESHCRISDDEIYIRRVKEYIEVKQNKGKKQYYYNPHKKKF
jgi:hypothetical protein